MNNAESEVGGAVSPEPPAPDRFRLRYEMAVDEKRETFTFDGEDYVTADVVLAAIDSYCASSTPDGEVVVGDKDGNMAGWHIIKWRDGLPPLALGTKVYLKEST